MRLGKPCAPRLSLLVATFSVLLASEAAADPPDSRVRLAWARGEGADGCLDERELERRVRVRLGRDPFAVNGARTIEGNVAARAGRYAVELCVRDASGALAGRRRLDVAASDCGVLTEAIVLAVALAIDPRAPLADPASGPPPSLSSPDANQPMQSVEPSLSGDASAEPSVPPEAAPECPRAPLRACPACSAPVCSEPRLGSGLTTRAALRALGAIGVLPNFAPGLGIRAAAGGSLFEVTAGTSYFPEQETGEFGFGLSTLHLGACGLVRVSAGLTASLCAELQAGAMHAVVRELQPLDTGDHFWGALALGPEVRFQPFAPLALEASVLGIVPVRRPRFAVRGEPHGVFESRQLGAVVSVGVGVSGP